MVPKHAVAFTSHPAQGLSLEVRLDEDELDPYRLKYLQDIVCWTYSCIVGRTHALRSSTDS